MPDQNTIKGHLRVFGDESRSMKASLLSAEIGLQTYGYFIPNPRDYASKDQPPPPTTLM